MSVKTAVAAATPAPWAEIVATWEMQEAVEIVSNDPELADLLARLAEEEQ